MADGKVYFFEGAIISNTPPIPSFPDVETLLAALMTVILATAVLKRRVARTYMYRLT